LVASGAGLITAIIGLILGISGRRKAVEAGAPTDLATAGIVLSIISLAISVLTLLICISCIAAGGIAAFEAYNYGNAWDWY